MTADPSDADRERAAELAARGRELHDQMQYEQAAEFYRASLRLHEDPDVRVAYHVVLSAFGPL